MIRIDTSGWSDDHWVGVLFRSGHRVSARLARYVHEFDTVELNASSDQTTFPDAKSSREQSIYEFQC